MKLKKEYIILIVVIIALVLYLTLRSANDNNGELPQPEKLESAKIDRLVMVKGSDKIELDKKDDQWIIESSGYRADNEKVKKMVTALADLTLTALVSESGNYTRYGLNADDKCLVKAYIDGKTVRQINIGKAAPTHQHTFVLLEGDPKVYHARGQIEKTFDFSDDALRDKTIFDVDKDSIASITFSKGGQELTLTKKEVVKEAPQPPAEDKAETSAEASPTPTPTEIQWQAPDGEAVDKNKVDQLLGKIAQLKCDGFGDEKTAQQFTDAVWNVRFKTASDEYTLSAFAKENEDADQVPATASSATYAFYLKKWRIDQFETSIMELMGIKEEKK